MESIPRVDFSSIALSVPDDEINDEVLMTVGRQLMVAFTEIGFCYMENHGISQDFINTCLDFCRHFYAMPVDVKRKVLRPDGMVDLTGWVPGPDTPGLEAKAEHFTKTGPLDDKESYSLKRSSPASKYLSEDELPGFRDVAVRLIDVYDVLLRRILVALGHALALEDPTALLNFVKLLGRDDNDSVLRFGYYPRRGPEELVEGQLRCGEHTDFGLITFLFQNSVPGLQVFTRSQTYIDVPPVEGAILLNVCDLMERITGGVLVSAKHRVVMDECLAASERYTVIYFSGADQEAVVEALCGERKRYGERVTCGDFTQRRIVDIFVRGEGVIKHTID